MRPIGEDEDKWSREWGGGERLNNRYIYHDSQFSQFCFGRCFIFSITMKYFSFKVFSIPFQNYTIHIYIYIYIYKFNKYNSNSRKINYKLCNTNTMLNKYNFKI